MAGAFFMLVLALLVGGGAYLVDLVGAKNALAIERSNERVRVRIDESGQRQQETKVRIQREIEALRVEEPEQAQEGEPCPRDCFVQL